LVRIIELLGQINGILLRSLKPIMREEGFSYAEMIILWAINKRGTCRITDLARDVSIPCSTFTGMLDRLADRKLLTREHDLKDRRSVLVKGTPELQELIGRIKSAAEARISELFELMPEELSRRFLEDLQLVHRYLMEKGSGGQGGK